MPYKIFTGDNLYRDSYGVSHEFDTYLEALSYVVHDTPDTREYNIIHVSEVDYEVPKERTDCKG